MAANRERIMTAYAATKSRVRNALFAATGKSYGVRKEWRVSWWQWSVFDPLPMGFENQFHGPYWVLPIECRVELHSLGYKPMVVPGRGDDRPHS